VSQAGIVTSDLVRSGMLRIPGESSGIKRTEYGTRVQGRQLNKRARHAIQNYAMICSDVKQNKCNRPLPRCRECGYHHVGECRTNVCHKCGKVGL